MSLQHLYAMIASVAHYDAPLAVNHNTPGTVELPISTTFATDGSNVAAIAVAQHLHSMIIVIGYNDVACTIQRHAAGLIELSRA